MFAKTVGYLRQFNSNALLAFAAVVVGFFGLGLFTWAIAGIAGSAALTEFKTRGNDLGRGRWMAITGAVVGWFWIAVLTVVVVALIVKVFTQ